MTCRTCRVITHPGALRRHPFHEEQSLADAAEHIGLALVAIDERAHWLKALGQLQAAASHVAKWPELHAAIKAAAEAWKHGRNTPDWDALGKLIDENA